MASSATQSPQHHSAGEILHRLMKSKQKQYVVTDCNRGLLTHMLHCWESITVIDGNLTSRYGRLRLGCAAWEVFDAHCPHSGFSGASRHRSGRGGISWDWVFPPPTASRTASTSRGSSGSTRRRRQSRTSSSSIETCRRSSGGSAPVDQSCSPTCPTVWSFRAAGTFVSSISSMPEVSSPCFGAPS